MLEIQEMMEKVPHGVKGGKKMTSLGKENQLGREAPATRGKCW
ncbi:MAG: hypothetical protein N2039_01180 [Gemmataceae bacterium]|nr:hypothetical protein [Gemmataceae bacterium]